MFALGKRGRCLAVSELFEVEIGSLVRARGVVEDVHDAADGVMHRDLTEARDAIAAGWIGASAMAMAAACDELSGVGEVLVADTGKLANDFDDAARTYANQDNANAELFGQADVGLGAVGGAQRLNL